MLYCMAGFHLGKDIPQAVKHLLQVLRQSGGVYHRRGIPAN
ncbi:hypothetical protein FLA_5476 [Filimonas lacunae]|nr:hypothetical protein FLA_5476 [Filimonas lacunae]